jgi:hypothetical protein
MHDCEGYEKILFSNKLGPNTKTMQPLSRGMVAGALKQVRSALDGCHSVGAFCDPWPGVYPFDLGLLTAQKKEKAMREIRPGQEWLLCLSDAL